MKNPFNKIPFFAVTMLLAIATTFTGCKDDDKDEPQLPKSYRMKTMEYTNDGEHTTINFSYTSDNKLQMVSSSMSGVVLYKSEFVWEGNEATVTETYLDEGIWQTESEIQKLTFVNGHVSSSKYMVGDQISSTTTYTWNGDLLTKEITEYYSETGHNWLYTIDYNYDGNRLTSADYTYTGQIAGRQVIEYQNGAPVALKGYDHNNVMGNSSHFLYTGSNITTINSLHVVEGVEGNIECTETRGYDANNCNTDITTTCPDDYSYSSHILFEEGTSNMRDYLLTQTSWISVYLFPNTFPCELAMKKKK